MRERSSSLTFSHISRAVDKSLMYIKGRRDGTIKSLKTGFDKLDEALLDGIEWNKIFSIAAMSGSGKSVFLEQLKRQVLELNPEENIDILSFDFEMPSYEQVTRNLSGAVNVSTQDLYSAREVISDTTLERVEKVADRFKKLPIFTVDDVGTVDQIINTIHSFIKKREMISRKAKLMVTLDHALLTQMKQGEDERKTIAYLYRSIVALRKTLENNGIDCLFIFLNQLNRSIETLDRKSNPDYHYPNRNDLFGSNDIFMGSDYVLIIHKPAILNLDAYGPPKGEFMRGLPCYNPKNPSQPMLYFHVLKQRGGKPCILMMLDDFKNSKIQTYE